MIRFLNKESDLHLMEQLFDLLYVNMLPIAPSGLTYEKEKQQWMSEVVPAMAKAPRQIVLMYDGDTLVGYLQYYINSGLFMVEELQLRKDCRSTSLFAALWKFMCRVIPKDTHTTEAYADPRNLKSCHLMKKLGMQPVADDSCGNLFHFRGALEKWRS